jgi:hypothetical protein
MGPSAPTPRPPSQVPLPSRQSVRGVPPSAHGRPKPPAPDREDAEEVEVINEIFEKRSWDEKLGSLGIAAIALAACAIAFVVVKFVL